MLLRVFYYMVGGNASTGQNNNVGTKLRNTSNTIQSGTLCFNQTLAIYSGLLNPSRYAKVNQGRTANNASETVIDYNGLSLVLGKGDTPPTLDDYTLADPVTENLTVTKRSGSNTKDTNSVWAVTNNETSSITLKEFGFMNCTPSANGTNINYNILYVRGLFDTPVTIAPGETKAIMISLC